MPETRVIEVTPNRLLKGDVLHNGAYVVTGSPDPKQKYVYVPVNDGDTARLKLDETLSVSRVFPTEEEAAAQNRERAIAWIIESQERAALRLVTAREKLVSNLDMRDANWHGRHWASYAEAQIEYHLWNYVFQVADNRRVDLYDALLLVRDELLKRLIDYGHFLPRSTNPLQNYCEGLESETRLKFIQNTEYHLV